MLDVAALQEFRQTRFFNRWDGYRPSEFIADSERAIRSLIDRPIALGPAVSDDVVRQYGIEHPYQEREPGRLRLDMGFEQLMGLSCEWDCVEQANLDQCIALLKDLVLRCAEFTRALPV